MNHHHQQLPRDGVEQQGSSSGARGELAGMDQGMRVLSYLIAGVLVYGALGWLGDRYLGTGFLLPLGIVLGAAGGCYVIIRRYGQVPNSSHSSPGTRPGHASRPTSRQGSTHDTKTEGAR